MDVSETYSPPAQIRTLDKELRLLEHGDGVVDFSGHGILRLEGRDTLDFLHRISTNDLKDLLFGQSTQTILATEKGRVIDSIVVHHRGDFLLLITGRGAGQQVQRWLEKFIIMDDVKITDLSGRWTLLVQMNSSATGNNPVHTGPGYSFGVRYFGKNTTFYYWDDPAQSGEVDAKKISNEAFDLYCIENGIIQTNPEVLLECNPLELNLWDQISFTKGCYIGQEIIARLDTYKKVQRTLCRIRTENEFRGSTNQRLTFQQKELGILLNDGFKKALAGHWVSLAVIRNEYAVPGGNYMPDNSQTSVIIDRIFEPSDIGNGNDHNNH
jgi:folate-binding protein YgfZ